MKDVNFDNMREVMIKEQIMGRGVNDTRVIEALRKVKRHLFVAKDLRNYAYDDGPLSIRYNQTISQPYMVGFMSAILALKKTDRVLEIGTGSGYQTAILAEIVKDVYSMESIEPLAQTSRNRLREMGYQNIQIKVGSGYEGWVEYAPYDAVMVTAAAPELPQALVDQLKEGGKMVIPMGTVDQELFLIQKRKQEMIRECLFAVRFVPMVKEK